MLNNQSYKMAFVDVELFFMADERVWMDFIFNLKAKNDIVDVISSYLHVVQKGRSFVALCPFHNDRNPSLSINREGQFFHCFVCKAGGDVIKFVQDYESCSFLEAVEILAKRANMEVPQRQGFLEEREIADKKKLKQECAELCLFAARYYYGNLFLKQNAYALDYLKQRGLSLSTIKRFGFGLSCDYDGLPSALIAAKKNMESAVKAGLVVQRNDKTFFDSLAQRLIVPIFDINGNVIAFGGRTFSHDKTVAKYKNTTVTPLFDKSKTLYALNYAKKAKQSGNLDFVVVVEGYMDAIALHQAGLNCVVASMGTSLTVEQAKQIKRLVQTVYICYDGDAAGQNATLRGLDILKEQELDVRVVVLPKDVDPDEYVKNYGAEKFKKLLSEALPLTDYKLLMAKRELAPKTEGKVAFNEFRRKYAEAAVKILKPLGDIERESYVVALSDDTGLTADFLRRQLSNATQETVGVQTDPLTLNDNNGFTLSVKAAAYVLACKLNLKSFADDGKSYFCENAFLNTVFDYIKKCGENNCRVTLGDLYRLDDVDQNKDAVDLIVNTQFLYDEVDKKCYEDCVDVLSKVDMNFELDKLKSTYSVETDTEKKRDILFKIAALTQKINQK